MAPYPSKPSYFYLHPNAITFGFNALGDPDNLAISIYSNAKVSAYIREIDEHDSLGFTPADEYRQWTLAAFPTHFTDEEGCERYAHIAISRTTGNATLVFPPTLLDVYGRAITEDGKYFLDEDGKPMIPPEEPKEEEEAPGAEASADPSAQAEDPETSETSETPETPSDTPDYEEPSTDGDYFFFFIGKITSSQGGTKNREWASKAFPVTGTLDTARYWEEEQKGDWAKMFSLNETMQWIEQHFPINISKIHNLVMRGLDKLKEITIKGIFAQGDKLEDVPVKDLDSYLPTLGAVRNMSEGQFLSKVHDDAAKGNITFEQSISVLQRILLGKNTGEGGNYMGSAAFVTGLLGYGFRINEAGHAEFDSVSIRKFLEVPELRFNRITVRTGVEWHTFGAGLIEEVIHPAGFPANQGVIKLKLEDGEYGAIAANDYCMGIYHYEGEPTDEPVDFSFENYEPADNEEKVVDNRNGNFAFAGFATIYFKIIGVCDKHGDQSHPDSKNQYFVYELREDWTLILKRDGMEIFNKQMTAYHPQPNMSFACYANPNDPERQACEYRTTKYTVLLTGMTDWTYDGSNIAMVTGWLEGFSIPSTLSPNGSKDLKGSGIAFGNAYMWGTIDQFDRPAYIITQEIYTMITADLPSIVQEHVEAGDWQTAYDWSSGIKSATESQPYCYSYWKQTYDNGDETFVGPTLTGYHTSLVSLELSKEIVSVAVSDWYIDGEEGTDDIEFDVTARLKLGTNYATITSAVATSDIDGFSYDVELLPEESVPGSPVHSYARFHITIHGYVGQNIDGTTVENNFVNITLFDEFGNNATRPVTISENRKGEDGENGAPGEQGPKGDKGDPGTSLTEVINYYAWGSSGENPPYPKDDERWSTGTIPSHPDSDTLCYLWNYEQCLDAEGVLISGSDPACIGYYPNDGLGIKDIKEYYRVHTSPTAAPTPIPSVSADGKTLTIPAQWKLEPDPTDNTNKNLWNCEVVQMSDDTYRVNTPHVAGTHGEAGVDGPGQEFVFLRSDVEPTLDAYDVNSAEYQAPEFLPTSTFSGRRVSWTDDPKGVDKDHPIEWVVKRNFKDGKWQSFGSPAKWATFAENGKSVFVTYHDSNSVTAPSGDPGVLGEQNGWHTTPDANCVWVRQKLAEDITNGTWGPAYRVRGADGTSVRIIDHVPTVADLDKITNPADNDAYIVDADGHLYTWSATKNEWIDCGRIQGEAGKTAYVHIKYSDDGEHFTEPDGETEGAWMGIYTDNSPEDSNVFSDYTWKKIEGEKGDKGDKGDPGENAFILDIDNEMTSIPVSESGSTMQDITLTFGLSCFYGSTNVTSECTVSIEGETINGMAVDVTDMSHPLVTIANETIMPEITEITFKASHPTYGERKAVFSIAAVKSGGQGQDAELQELLPSLSQISFARAADGQTLTPESRTVTCTIKKTTGSQVTIQDLDESGLTVKYSMQSMPTSTRGGTKLTAGGVEVPSTTTSQYLYLAAFNASGQLIDRETIPVVKDGTKGQPGTPGRNISQVDNYYAWLDHGTLAPNETIVWGAPNAIPSHPEGKDYLWNYESCSDKDIEGDIPINSEPACIGYYPKDGVGIESITEYYAVNDNNTVPPEGKPALLDDGKSYTTSWALHASTDDTNHYLWNSEVTKKTDGTYIIAPPHVAGVQGTRGSDGTSITPRGSYDNKVALLSAYRAGAMNPMPTDGDAYITSDDGHLHAYSSYLAATPGNTDPFVDLGPFRGEDGRSIAKVVNYYAWYNKGDEYPSIDSIYWGAPNQIPTHPAGSDYLWNYELYQDTEEGEIGSTNPIPVCIGYYPKDGKDGKGIQKIYEYFHASSSADTYPELPKFNNSDGDFANSDRKGWSQSPSDTPTDAVVNKYLWNFEHIKYSDNTYSYSTPHIAGVHGDNGTTPQKGIDYKDGKDGYNGCSIRTTYWREAPQYFTETITGKVTLTYQKPDDNNFVIDTSNDALKESYFMFVGHYIQGRVRFDSLSIKVDGTSTYLGVDPAFSAPWKNEPFEVEFNGQPLQNINLPINLSADIRNILNAQKPSVTLVVTLEVTFINCSFGINNEPKDGYVAPNGTRPDGRNNFKFQWCFQWTDGTNRSTSWKVFTLSRVPLQPSVSAPEIVNGTYSGNAMVYRNDSENQSPALRVIDIVLVEDSSSYTGYRAYMCKQTHVADLPINKPSDTSDYWSKANTLDFLSVNMLLAKYAKIEMASGNQFLIMGQDAFNNNVVLGGISGYGTDSDEIRLWIGSSNPAEAPFRVNHRGDVIAESFATGVEGSPYMRVQDGLFEVFGKNQWQFPNIKFGVEEGGMAVLQFLDDNGVVQYDLGSKFGLRRIADTTFRSYFSNPVEYYFFRTGNGLFNYDGSPGPNANIVTFTPTTIDTIYQFVAGRTANVIDPSIAGYNLLWYRTNEMQNVEDGYRSYPAPEPLNGKVSALAVLGDSPIHVLDWSEKIKSGVYQEGHILTAQELSNLYKGTPWSRQEDIKAESGKYLYYRNVVEFKNGVSYTQRVVFANFTSRPSTTAAYSDAPDDDPLHPDSGDISTTPSEDGGTIDKEL